jgi:hypothetical protein
MKECLEFQGRFKTTRLTLTDLTVTFETSGQHPGVNNKHTPFLLEWGTKMDSKQPLNFLTDSTLETVQQSVGNIIYIGCKQHTFAVLGYIHCGQNTALTLMNPFFTKILICDFSTASPVTVQNVHY